MTGLGIKIKLDVQIAVLMRAITDFIQVLAIDLLEPSEVELRFPLPQIQQGPGRGQFAAPQAFAYGCILHEHKSSERRATLLVSGKRDRVFISVKNKLLSSVIDVLEFHHELKLFAFGNQYCLSVQYPRAAHQNFELHRPLHCPSLKGGS